MLREWVGGFVCSRNELDDVCYVQKVYRSIEEGGDCICLNIMNRNILKTVTVAFWRGICQTDIIVILIRIVWRM